MLYRVCYADTDAGGVVYHATYLSFFERARTEFFRERGVSVRDLHDSGTVFPVIRIEADFKGAARLDDLLLIESQIVEVGRTTFTFLQRCIRENDGKLLAEARITLVSVGPGMKPKRLSPEILSFLKELLTQSV